MTKRARRKGEIRNLFVDLLDVTLDPSCADVTASRGAWKAR